MARIHVPDHVEYPDKYIAAAEARIRNNRRTTNRRKLDAAIADDGLDFRAWLFDLPIDAIREQLPIVAPEGYDDIEPYHAAVDRLTKQWRRRFGYAPPFVREALEKWGGLTDGQLAAARRTFAKFVERAEGRDVEENARRARAPHWTAGRQTFTGTVQSVRVSETVVAYNTSATIVKGLVTLEDGRKVWTSLPKAAMTEDLANSDEGWTKGYEALKGLTLTMTVTIEPSDDDPTMAFGSRPHLPKARAKAATTSRNDETPETSADAKRDAKRARAAARRAKRRAIAGDASADGSTDITA
jgi:hypothetical protein